MKNKRFRRAAVALAAVLALMPALAPGRSETASGAVDLLSVDHRLYELGYRDDNCNGELDEVTVAALRNFQTANQLPVTGEPDSATVEMLFSEDAVGEADYLNALVAQNAQIGMLSSGAYGSAVSTLQTALKALGYFQGSSDGAFGDATEAAVRRFQLVNGLEQTGVADSMVQVRLYAGNALSWDTFLHASCAVAGDSGAQVKRLQRALRELGYYRGDLTGKFGEGTQQAVKLFQNDLNLEQSGDADLVTCTELYQRIAELSASGRPLSLGDSGDEVDRLQTMLSAYGYAAKLSGVYDASTEIAVMQFQLANNLTVSGRADADTLARLNGSGAAGMGDARLAAGTLQADDATLSRISRNAAAMLGRNPGLTSEIQFVQYVLLKSGVAMYAQDSISYAPLDGESARAGDVILMQCDDGEHTGFATGDGAVIYLDASGFVIMRYLNVMGVQASFRWQAEAGE